MVTINNFKILLKLKKDYNNFYVKNSRVFYEIEGIILIILDILTKMKRDERDILSQGFLERLLNILGSYLLEELVIESHDLISSFVIIYHGIMENEEVTQWDNVKYCPHLLVFCGLAADRMVGIKSSELAQRIINHMNLKKKFQVYNELLEIDSISAFKMVNIPKPKWYAMFFGIISENIKQDIDNDDIKVLCLKSTEEFLKIVNPQFMKSVEDGNLE